MFTISGSELCMERKTRRKQQHFMFHHVEVNLAWVDGINNCIPPSDGSMAGERETFFLILSKSSPLMALYSLYLARRESTGSLLLIVLLGSGVGGGGGNAN